MHSERGDGRLSLGCEGRLTNRVRASHAAASRCKEVEKDVAPTSRQRHLHTVGTVLYGGTVVQGAQI